MNIRKIVQIFNRDIQAISLFERGYKIQIISDAIEFYTNELAMPDGHQSKIFTDYEYRLLIKLYQEELTNILIKK
jgi:hypothetical protein